MLISGITGRFIIILFTAAVAYGSLYTIRYLLRLKRRLNTSIVLIPLYKTKIPLIVGAAIVFALIVIDIIYLASAPENAYIPLSILIMLIFILAMLITLITQRFAVIDTGIIAPYRYIDWIQFTDYAIEGKTVFFTGGKNGFSGLSSTTMKMYFNPVDLNKLELILSRNKNRN
ncbi:MAG: hypothetical protein ACOX3U_00495 [Christensenellales bacterium]|jgi:hypothetical protein